MDRYEVILVVVGLAALVAAWAPAFTERRPLSLPIVLLGLGLVVAATPLGLPVPDPTGAHLEHTERFTELAVIVSLMGAGLKIDRPFRWRTWRSTWRMLGIAMPLTIAMTAIGGVAIGGLTGAGALLLGAVLAPTDPVLASDVQVGEPSLEAEPPPDAEDEVRFTLTSEAGLNDALAFPFVYGAIFVNAHGWSVSHAATWLAWDLIGRLAIALAIGWLVGRLLGIIAFHPPAPLRALSETPQGFVAVAATLLSYGITELCQGYGFLAVFTAALMLRNSEQAHEFLGDLHSFAEQVENLLIVGLLLLLGATLASGILDHLTWNGALIALLLVFAIRPAAGWLALTRSPIASTERWAIAFFGIRGFGSVYYLAYALSTATFADAEALWSIVALAVVCSIATHGVTATPVMQLVDRVTERRRRRDRSHLGRGVAGPSHPSGPDPRD